MWRHPLCVWPMRFTRLLLAFLIGCSKSEPVEAFGEPIGIVLQGEGNRLEIRVAFLGDVAPEPHVEPLANVLLKAREKCFSKVGQEVVATVRATIADRKIKIKSNNPWGECLAKEIDGAVINDPATLETQISVSVMASGSGTPGSNRP